MSRIGKKPIVVPKNVKVAVNDGILFIEGPQGKLQQALPSVISCEQKDGTLIFSRGNEIKTSRAIHGTMRAISQNMITGVSKGFSKSLVLSGVGYKAQVQGNNLKLNVGFTHPVIYPIPAGIKIDASKQVEIAISGIDKAKVGQVAAEIRHICPPEPYKGKGIRYKDERVRRKVGKAVTK